MEDLDVELKKEEFDYVNSKFAETSIPIEVHVKVLLEGKSLLRAWREHRNFTKEDVALYLGITDTEYAQLEDPGVCSDATALAEAARLIIVNPSLLGI